MKPYKIKLISNTDKDTVGDWKGKVASLTQKEKDNFIKQGTVSASDFIAWCEECGVSDDMPLLEAMSQYQLSQSTIKELRIRMSKVPDPSPTGFNSLLLWCDSNNIKDDEIVFDVLKKYVAKQKQNP
jgi:hypothetical protein